jgi:hypothetical protein
MERRRRGLRSENAGACLDRTTCVRREDSCFRFVCGHRAQRCGRSPQPSRVRVGSGGRLGRSRASTRLRPVGPVCAASAAVARGDARAARAPAHAPGPAGTDGREWASFEPEPVRCAFKTLKEMDS